MIEFELHLGDCLEILPTLEADSVDAVITDIPYGTTACSWDEVIPLDDMWREVERVSNVFITTASQPFTSLLVMSNLDWFKYEWIWEKTNAKGHLNSHKRPLIATENICVFFRNDHTYNPQGLKRRIVNNSRPAKSRGILGKTVYRPEREFGLSEYINYPRNIIKISNPNNQSVHPTQKPVALYKYLINTYTNEDDTVLDIAMGSGTTGVACMQTGRNFIGIEIEPKYYDIAERRIKEAKMQLRLGI